MSKDRTSLYLDRELLDELEGHYAAESTSYAVTMAIKEVLGYEVQEGAQAKGETKANDNEVQEIKEALSEIRFRLDEVEGQAKENKEAIREMRFG